MLETSSDFSITESDLGSHEADKWRYFTSPSITAPSYSHRIPVVLGSAAHGWRLNQESF